MMATATQDFVRIFDTTLRDGEQSPGATMNTGEKLAIARQLEALGVDVIEAGFAASSEGDFDAIRQVAAAVREPIVLSLARTRAPDIERALAAVEGASHPGLHVFIATSDIHLQHKLMMSREQVVEAAVWAVERARQHVDHVEFSAEDASRSDVNFLCQIFAEVIRAGATVCNVPDTTGYAIPEQTAALFRRLRSEVNGGDRVIWSAHCHNDLGMAVGNSLAAVQGGARQIECTINGIGERAGNTSLEEVVMALKTRRDVFGVDTHVRTEQIFSASRLLSQVTGIAVPINKPIVGDNAFAHEAGIHQDGVLKYKLTYEIMRPQDVGRPTNTLVLGKHSGRHAFVDRLRSLGLFHDGIDVNDAFKAFKALADRKKSVYDEDLVAIVARESASAEARYALLDFECASSTMGQPRARVRLAIAGREIGVDATGDGVIDAVYAAIGGALESVGDQVPTLDRYDVKSITKGADAQGEVSCLLREEGRVALGRSSHTDIIQASAEAYVAALNKLSWLRAHRPAGEEPTGP